VIPVAKLSRERKASKWKQPRGAQFSFFRQGEIWVDRIVVKDEEEEVRERDSIIEDVLRGVEMKFREDGRGRRTHMTKIPRNLPKLQVIDGKKVSTYLRELEDFFNSAIVFSVETEDLARAMLSATTGSMAASRGLRNMIGTDPKNQHETCEELKRVFLKGAIGPSLKNQAKKEWKGLNQTDSSSREHKEVVGILDLSCRNPKRKQRESLLIR